MSKENDFPAFAAGGHPYLQHIQQEGISARDYFAAKAMQSLYSRAGGSPAIDQDSCDYFAHHAYLMADAMLEARNK